ncbi:hypothetical protein [Bowmanella yangjiangensis]|uniref:Uncharacterized protein n=1 Tax=Bowmanella yangjiangensis TaxID=2811230 RepID=A0ABS3CVI0_9ALTE|nr:hypothetical protein [Bowmanella yangjiangensis]MBN7820529.1 hypothetical protein [Bowmanella yangjiangensis]
MAFNNPQDPSVNQPLFDALLAAVEALLMSKVDGASLWDNIRDELSSQIYNFITRADSPNSVRVWISNLMAELQSTEPGSILERISYNNDAIFDNRNYLGGLINGLADKSAKRFGVTQTLLNAASSRLAYGVVSSSSHIEIFNYSGSGLITKCKSTSNLGWRIIADGVTVVDDLGQGNGSNQVAPVDITNSESILGVPFDTSIVISARKNGGTDVGATVFGGIYS